MKKSEISYHHLCLLKEKDAEKIHVDHGMGSWMSQQWKECGINGPNWEDRIVVIGKLYPGIRSYTGTNT